MKNNSITQNYARNGVTTPRWKKFNGMNIRLKDRIRLNNAIWRCWYIECTYLTIKMNIFSHIKLKGLNKVLPRKKKMIQFLTPLDSDFADKEVYKLNTRRVHLPFHYSPIWHQPFCCRGFQCLIIQWKV